MHSRYIFQETSYEQAADGDECSKDVAVADVPHSHKNSPGANVSQLVRVCVWQDTAHLDLHLGRGPASTRADGLELGQDGMAARRGNALHLAEDNVLAVEVRCGLEGDEKLRPDAGGAAGRGACVHECAACARACARVCARARWREAQTLVRIRTRVGH